MSKKIIASILAIVFLLSIVGPVKAVTIEELQTQIAGLLTMITQLQAQLAGMTTGQPVTTSTIVGQPVATSTIIPFCGQEGEKLNRNPFFGTTNKVCCSGLTDIRESKSYSICTNCGDKICKYPENLTNCPKDCESNISVLPECQWCGAACMRVYSWMACPDMVHKPGYYCGEFNGQCVVGHAPQFTIQPTTTTTIPSTTTTSARLCLYNTLSLGMRSTEVKILQQGLRQDSAVYHEGLITGYFDSLTKAAVTRFQKKYGIKSTGQVGPETRAKFNNLYCIPTITTTTTMPSCKDSDGGKNYYTKGFVSDKYTMSSPNGKIYDNCSIKDKNSGSYTFTSSCSGENCFLAEYFCVSKVNHDTEMYHCPNGCSNGACKLTIVTPTITINPPADCHTSKPWSWTYCSSSCKCDAGQGDCDRDTDCNTGHCSQNVGSRYGQIASMDVCETVHTTVTYPSIPTTSIPTTITGHNCTKLKEIITNAYGSECNGIKYSKFADINDDKKVDFEDLMVFGMNADNEAWCLKQLLSTTNPCGTSFAPTNPISYVLNRLNASLISLMELLKTMGE